VSDELALSNEAVDHASHLLPTRSSDGSLDQMHLVRMRLATTMA
jgi:hypothetical protein